MHIWICNLNPAAPRDNSPLLPAAARLVADPFGAVGAYATPGGYCHPAFVAPADSHALAGLRRQGHWSLPATHVDRQRHRVAGGERSPAPRLPAETPACEGGSGEPTTGLTVRRTRLPLCGHGVADRISTVARTATSIWPPHASPRIRRKQAPSPLARGASPPGQPVEAFPGLVRRERAVVRRSAGAGPWAGSPGWSAGS